MDENKKLYAVACFAFKPDPAQQITHSTESCITTKCVTFGPEGYYNMAADFCSGYDYGLKEEIERDALQWAKEKNWPESEGWKAHRVHLTEIPIAEMLRGLSLPSRDTDAEATQGDEWQEFIDG